MSATTIFVIAIVAAAVLAAAGIFTVAYRRAGEGPVTGTLDRAAIRKDRAARKAEKAVAAAEPAAPPVEGDWETAVAVLEHAPPVPDPLSEREPLPVAEFNVTRRQFFNRALLGTFGIYLALFGLAGLAFMWPKLRGGFGSPITAGKVDELRAQLIQPDGSIKPLFVSAAQAWLVPFQAEEPGSSFEGLSVVAGAGSGEPGLMALWQKCVHLGCRVPDCVSSQGFECPCHGSKYNIHGEYSSGPAPRNMDRFVVGVADNGDFIIQTGAVIQTPRATKFTAIYPQGPNCV